MSPRPPRTPGIPRGTNSEESDELVSLRRELEHEKRLRDTIEWSNAELERTIEELEQEIECLSSTQNLDGGGGPGLPLGEWQVRLESQLAVNHQLENTKQWLELEVAQTKQQTAAGSLPAAMSFSLDALTETELIRLVKHLERNRTDLYSTLRDHEWKLDKQGKEYHRLSEIRAMYQAELRHYTRSLERLRIQQLHITDVSNNCGSVTPTSLNRWGGSNGIRANQRIIDPKKGPIKKTVGVRTLPKISQDENDKRPKGARKRRGITKPNNISPSVTVTDTSVEVPDVQSSSVAVEQTDDSGLPSTEDQTNSSKTQPETRQDSKEDTEDKDTEE